MIKQHIFYVPWTGLGLHNGFRGNKWLANRIKIFKSFVIPALMKQTNKNFVLWCSWRPEEKDNLLVKDLRIHLERLDGLTIVFTYGGLCFYDDKYDDETAKKRLLHSLTLSLPALKQHVDFADEVLLTINPSDDMFISTAIQTIQGADFGPNAVIGWEKGYCMNYADKTIAEYNPDTIAPFYTIKFPKDTFLDPKRHFDWIGPYRSHEYVRELGFRALEGRGYVVGCHGANISTNWDIPYKGRILTPAETDSVMLRTGSYFTEPIIIKQNGRLLLEN